jgi:predicted dehydrogenase
MEERARGAVAPADPGSETQANAALSVGIVGTGFVGRIHARAARLAGAGIAGVVASSPERSALAADELGAAQPFASAEDLIAADGIDVVHVCTPNHLHVPLTLDALAAGKHVVCEKPVALDAPSAERLVAAAASAGTVATVPFAYRYYPTVREARARVRRGYTGPVRLLQGGYLQDWLLRAEDDNWRVDTELGGASRAFADIGSHWCDLAEFVTGQRITSLTARTAIAHPKRRAGTGHSFERGDDGEAVLRDVETEDMATVLFETDTGAAGSVVISQVSAGRKNRLWFELAGEHETLGFDGEQPEALWVGTRNGATVIPRDPDGLDPSAAVYATLPAGHPQGYNDLFDAFVGETYAAVRGEAPADGLPTLADGLRAARVTDAVLESARTRSWVEVPA